MQHPSHWLGYPGFVIAAQDETPGMWGSKLEIAAAATMFKKTIYVASDSLAPGKC